MSENIVFVVGQHNGEGKSWSLVGVFDADNQLKAEAACGRNQERFVGSVPLNKVLPKEQWPGVYWPARDAAIAYERELEEKANAW